MKRSIKSPALAALLVFVAPALLRAQTNLDHLQIHGYVTQAYGQATDHQLYGLPTEGTWDYRAMALQLRYQLSYQDNIVFQVNHRRVGPRPLQQAFNDVELDWAYYQRRQGLFEGRAGRMPLPRGLFNEIRNVGTLIPFYRASNTFYEDGFEVVDGALGSFEWTTDAGWGARASAYAGEIPLRIQVVQADGLGVIDDRYLKAWGTQFAILTPWPGVRAMVSTANAERQGQPRSSFELSGEATFESFYLRGEHAGRDIGPTQTMYMWYVQSGVRVWGSLWANAQYEVLDRDYVDDALDFRATQDLGFGALYKFTPGLVAKAEWHDYEGFGLDSAMDMRGPAAETRYFILSLSVAY
jgi:hypothetical protein